MSDTSKWILGLLTTFLIGVVGGGTLWKGGWRVVRLLTEEDLKLRDRYYTREEGESLERRYDEMKAWVLVEGIGPLKDLAKAVQDVSLAVAALSAQNTYISRRTEEMAGDVRALRGEPTT